MAESYHFTIKPSILEKEHILDINPDTLHYKTCEFLKDEIEAIRYGVKGIHGYRFTIGRIYCIDIKNTSGKTIKLRLKSVYGVRKKHLGDKYINIVNALFTNYFSEIAKKYIEMFYSNVEFSILGTKISHEGVTLADNREQISWFDLDSKKYWHYYSLFSISDSSNNRSYYDIDEWNTVVLSSVINYILKAIKPE